MPVPSQKLLHRPILEMLNDAGEGILLLRDVKDALVQNFSLSEAELQERTPSGQQTRFDNRVYWAVSYLRRAGLLHSPSRASFQITEQGREILRTLTGVIEPSLLNRLIESMRDQEDSEVESVDVTDSDSGVPVLTEAADPSSDDVTPDEQMAELAQQMQKILAEDLLERMKITSPSHFENLVVELLEKMDYGKGESVGGVADGGIDGVINQDALGLEKIYVQAKRWQNTVGEPEIRNFSGSLSANGANKGVFITTSRFSATARQTASNVSLGPMFIRLIDGIELAKLMVAHDVGVMTETTYRVKKLDENYFVDDA